MNKNFIKHSEDFVCENCGTKVFGNGYTNHCPECLYSRHVDIDPGDRMENCFGLMRPMQVMAQGSKTMLVHKCEACGTIRKNRTAENDNFEAILILSKDCASKM